MSNIFIYEINFRCEDTLKAMIIKINRELNYFKHEIMRESARPEQSRFLAVLGPIKYTSQEYGLAFMYKIFVCDDEVDTANAKQTFERNPNKIFKMQPGIVRWF